MQGRGELHCDGLPLVFQPRAQPPLSPPPCGGPRAIDIHDRQLGPRAAGRPGQGDAV